MNQSRARFAASVAFAAAALAVSSAAAAQVSRGSGPLVVPADNRAVRDALAYVQRNEPQTISDQIAVCEIPAPPFKEAVRAQEMRRRFAALGLRNVRIDAEGNVIGERPGDGDGPVVVLAGHLDTVFPEGTDVRVRRDGTVLHGPGIGDDCRGLAVLMGVARALDAGQVRTRSTLVFVADVGEEGPGNLRGVRSLFERELKGRVGYFVSVDGDGLNLTKDAVGSFRYRVTFHGPGGHSYGDFGMPSPIHALGRAIARIADLQVPSTPKVTFNVGVVEGGTSVNSIAAEASMDVDMRSVDRAALDRVDAAFKAAVRQALAAENARWPRSPVRLTVAVERTGTRPAGTQRPDAPIVRAAQAAGRALGFSPQAGASSTDANIPISLGIPAVTIDGGGRGQGAHSPAESFDTRDSHLGTQWALLVAATLAGVR
ncbi:MAG TPA: M20/M25/M40 family metallo-hydrolase [Longimicrobiaceae bacterium]|nr:M20/M25/M40 family metallo-hydrolase [Longimicrobiaceae bacterium]